MRPLQGRPIWSPIRGFHFAQPPATGEDRYAVQSALTILAKRIPSCQLWVTHRRVVPSEPVAETVGLGVSRLPQPGPALPLGVL